MGADKPDRKPSGRPRLRRQNTTPRKTGKKGAAKPAATESEADRHARIDRELSASKLIGVAPPHTKTVTTAPPVPVLRERNRLPRPLADYGLPTYYHTCSVEKQRELRLAVLSSWFDPITPQILCTSLENFILAFRLWVDHYLRPARCCAHWYHYPDPDHKEEMVLLAMSPPLVDSLPSKLVEIAPRHTAKTVTLFIELFSMVAICRPNTPMIMSQAIGDLTEEKLGTLRRMIEDNDLIHADFGAQGTLWPKRYGISRKWNSEQMDFVHNESVIKGVSVGSKHRGRHPLLGLIDDPDDGVVSLNPEWRRSFYRWLLSVYVPMFARGGHIILMQTATNGLTPAYSMIHTDPKKDGWETITDATSTGSTGDFSDWRKRIWALHTEDPISGTWHSLWEAMYPVADRKRLEASLTTPVYMAEMQGQPMSGSVFMFRRHPVANAYMICDDYVLDLPTGRRWTLNEFKTRLQIVTAADPAGTDLGVEKCYSAGVAVGVGPDGDIYVLDCFNAHCEVETLVSTIIWDMGVRWSPSRSVWEKHGLQSLIIKMAEVEAKRLLSAGLRKPNIQGITSQNVLMSENLNVGRGQQKIARIIGTLKPAINTGRLRFRIFGEVVDPQGERHRAAYDEREDHHSLLRSLVDSFTERGGRGKIDLIDALEMGVRTIWSILGYEAMKEYDPNEKEYAEWEKVGIVWNQQKLPPSCWTKDSKGEMARRRAEHMGAWTLNDGGYVPPAMEDADNSSREFDPYAMYN